MKKSIQKKAKFLILPLLILLSLSIKAQNEAERNKIIEEYKVAATKVLKDKGTNVNLANFNPLETLLEIAKSHDKARKDRVTAYLIKNPTKKQDYEINGVSYHIDDINSDGTPRILSTKNAESANVIKTSSLYNGNSLGVNIQGQGMTAGVFDGGLIRATHELYQGRAIDKEPSGTAAGTVGGTDHQAHVTGTIIGGEILANPAARGMAFNAAAWCYNWDGVPAKATAFAQAGYLVSNHSYGPGNTNEELWYFGAYTQGAADMDQVIVSNPKYLQCWAAGNERTSNNNRTQTPCPSNGCGNKEGYDIMTGGCVAKNILNVGAVTSSAEMSNFSNWGPTDDGRIKPDIVAKGVAVTSSYATSDNTYNTGNGTSYASPAIAGTVLLLQQLYNSINSSFMDASGVRGLLLHTATDKGQAGPDYQFGWGLANAEYAGTTIIASNSTFGTHNTTAKIKLETNNPTAGSPLTYTIKAQGGIPLSTSICWTDDANTTMQSSTNGIDPTNTNLIYDFDMTVSDGTTTYYPWRGPGMANRTSLSINTIGTNDVDNFERVDIPTPTADAIYTVTITKKASSPATARNFTIIATGLKNTAADLNFASTLNTAQEVNGTVVGCVNYTDFPYTMTIANAPTGAATVTIVVDNTSTATEGKDFDISTNGTFGAGGSKILTFADGSAGAQSYTIRVYDDAILDPNEKINLSFTTTGGNATIGKIATKNILTINDNDNAITTIGPSVTTVGDATGAAGFERGITSRGDADLMMDHYFLASELTAAGLVANSPISGITLNIVLKQSITRPNFNIRMAHTTDAPTTSTTFLSPSAAGFTNCYSAASLSTVAGDNVYPFTSNFIWNGIDNVIVRYCYNGTVDLANNDFDRYNSKPNALGTDVKSVVYNFEPATANSDGCNLPTNSSATGHERPITKFTYTKSGTAIETVAAQTKTISIKTESGRYDFYSSTNKIIASLSNTTQDANCTTASIDAAGVGFITFGTGERSNKVWKITPSDNIASNGYKVTLYLTAAELAGKDPSTLKILKSSAVNAAGITTGNTTTAATTFTTNSEYSTFTATFTGFSLFSLGTSTTALPVNLVSFTGKSTENGNELTWKTSSEVNFSHFEIERSENAKAFEKIGKVNGNKAENYEFIDAASNNDLSYYRLKMVDLDGTLAYSKVIALDIENAKNSIGQIYPNPSNGDAKVSITSSESGKWTMKTFDISGKLLSKETISLQKGVNVVELKKLGNGMNYIQVSNGKTTEVRKVLKQ